jgi:hypothetical protein
MEGLFTGTSRSFVLSSCSCLILALILHQENILVGGDKRARIGGLGAACVQSSASTVEVDRFFHGAAPEVADPQRWGFTAGAGVSKASDMYAFGVLAWQVSIKCFWIQFGV